MRTGRVLQVVVNRLRLRDPVAEATVETAREGVRNVVGAGALAARVAKIDETHLVLILEFRRERTPIVEGARLAGRGCTRWALRPELGARSRSGYQARQFSREMNSPWRPAVRQVRPARVEAHAKLSSVHVVP